MKIIKLLILLFSFSAVITQASSLPSPDILAEIIKSAQKSGKPFNVYSFSEGNKDYVYYLEQARYIGNSKTPSGHIHIAGFKFIRSSPSGYETPPARGNKYIGFFDEKLNLKSFWLVDFKINEPFLKGSQLWFRGEFIVDFSNNKGSQTVDGNNNVLIDGQVKLLPE